MDSSAPVAEPPNATAQAPVMDVVPPPPLENNFTAAPAPIQISKADPKPVKVANTTDPAQVIKTRKPKNGSVTTAIISTVIIVLVLAALATYAYIKTK
jgi:hypothetical protein